MLWPHRGHGPSNRRLTNTANSQSARKMITPTTKPYSANRSATNAIANNASLTTHARDRTLSRHHEIIGAGHRSRRAPSHGAEAAHPANVQQHADRTDDGPSDLESTHRPVFLGSHIADVTVIVELIDSATFGLGKARSGEHQRIEARHAGPQQTCSDDVAQHGCCNFPMLPQHAKRYSHLLQLGPSKAPTWVLLWPRAPLRTGPMLRP